MVTVFGMGLELVGEMEMEVVMEMVEAQEVEGEGNLDLVDLEVQLEELVGLVEWGQMAQMETVHGMGLELVMAKMAKEEEENKTMEERESKVLDLIPLLRMCLTMTLILTKVLISLQIMDFKECLQLVWLT